jgi:hypothetical protein
MDRRCVLICARHFAAAYCHRLEPRKEEVVERPRICRERQKPESGAIVKLWIMKLLRDLPLGADLFPVRVPD